MNANGVAKKWEQRYFTTAERLVANGFVGRPVGIQMGANSEAIHLRRNKIESILNRSTEQEGAEAVR